MSYFFTSESVSEGHPDKIADQISDALLDNFLAYDPESKVALETLVTTGQVILAGEVKSKTYIDIQDITRDTITNIGYNHSDLKFAGESCGVISLIHDQSSEINQGVAKKELENQGAGDQGMMFGYATQEAENYMPLALDLSHKILLELKELRVKKIVPYLRPDAKAQVTIEYDSNNNPIKIDTIVLSTQHDEFDSDEKMLAKISNDVQSILIPNVIKKLPSKLQGLFNDDIKYHINPTGKFVIGGPHGDSGLTGRKIIVDTYGGKGAHGGGAFSGKDPSKVDRSAAYMARYLAKNLVAAGVSSEILVQLSFAIGVAAPTSIYIDSYGKNNLNISDEQLASLLLKKIDLRPYAIEQKLKLRNPIYNKTASYGHFGRENETIKQTFSNKYFGNVTKEVELFTWEKLDLIKDIKSWL